MNKEEAEKIYEEINEDKYLDQFSISDRFRDIYDAFVQSGDIESANNIKYENMVCDLITEKERKPEGYERDYFAPFGVSKEGRIYPDIEQIPGTFLEHLKKRIKETNNLFLKARYSDFLWYKLRGEKDAYKYARIAIDCFLDLGAYIFKQPEKELESIHHFERCFEISLLINDKKRNNIVKTVIFNLMKNALKEKPILTMDLGLVLIKNMILLNENEKKTLIYNLKEGYEKCVKPKRKIGFHFQRKFLSVIETYFRKLNDQEKANVYRTKIAETFEKEAEELKKQGVSGTRIAIALNSAIQNYKLAGATENKIDKLLEDLRTANEEVVKSMKEHSVKVEIPKEKFDEFFKPFEKEDKDDLIQFLMVHDLREFGLHDYNTAIIEAKKMEEEFPLRSLATSIIYDSYNNIIFTPRTPEENLEYTALNDVMKLNYLYFADMFLRRIFQILIQDKKTNEDDIMKYIHKSDLISNDRTLVLKHAIKSFFQLDFINFLHTSVIQIEGILRDLLFNLGVNTTRYVREGRYRQKNLNEIIEEQEVKKVLGELNISLIRVVLADFLGFNIRNKLAHGLFRYDELDFQKSLLVMLIILRLSAYTLTSKKKNKKENRKS